MNVLFRSPVGAFLARPWLDGVGLAGLRRWYLPLSRLWAAANVAGEDIARFRDEIGGPLPKAWPDAYLRRLLRRNRLARDAGLDARDSWERTIFSRRGGWRELDWQRRVAATRHLSTRGLFYPLLFPRRAPTARWRIAPPEAVGRDLGPMFSSPGSLYAVPSMPAEIEVSPDVEHDGVREYWVRAPTPAPRLARWPGSAIMYARVIEPLAKAPRHTLVFGSGLGLEAELLAVAPDAGTRLAELGFRVIEPISPFHGLRAMPGYYGGEPFFAEGPTSGIDLIAGQAIETAALIAWARDRFGGNVAVAGISMTSFVAQQVASWCHTWPIRSRPDAVMLISHSGRAEDVTFNGALAATVGFDRALTDAGWSRAGLAEVSTLVDPAPTPGLPPSRILSVLGETDRWVPYKDGLDLAQRWQLPESNMFRYPLGHLGMPVQLVRDGAPFRRLRQILEAA
jgi:hypothetical protein